MIARPPARRSTALPPPPPRARGWFVGERVTGSKRPLMLLLAFLAVGVILTVHLFDIQIVESHWLSTQAKSQHVQSVAIPANRGDIYDRYGHVLASNTTVYDIYADPTMIASGSRDGVASQLAPILNVSAATIAQRLTEPTRFVYLAKAVSQDTEHRVAALKIPGIGAQAAQQRVYNTSAVPGQSFAEPLLGFVSNDGHGQYGVEQYYNSVLTGTPGSESTVTDLQGNPIVLSNQTSKPAHNGDDLQLGLDPQVQYWAEQAIAQGVTTAQAQSGEILVMDSHTGSIRAWAQYPTYNANAYQSTPVSNFRDDSIGALYEPGSTMKVVTWAGGLQNGAITPGYTFNEAPTNVDGYTIQDWDKRAHGLVSMQTALDLSLNNGAIKVATLEGHNAFYSNLLAFGIGAPTGVDLSGEQDSPLPPQASWADVNYDTAAFGQGVETSPVEMLAAINAVANDGVWIQPHAVDNIVDSTTGRSTPVVPTTRRVISSATAATMKQMMVGVVEDKGAEGYLAKIPGFHGEIAGKTWTADEPTNGQYQGALVVSFAGFMPVQNPQFTMLVVIRYPQTTSIPRFGSMLAAPVWRSVAEVIIDQWRILP